MTPLGRFLSVLSEIAPHLPKSHSLQRFEAARQASRDDNVDSAAEALSIRPDSIERTVRLIKRRSLRGLIGRPHVSGTSPEQHRLRLAQLLLGALTEERFEREKEELVAGRLRVEDHRLGRTDTDYRVLNGGGRPIFRINIKFHGAEFVKARDRVGLDPTDCFALATYKIHQALERQRAEALPYVFLVLSCLGTTAKSVTDLIPEDFAWFLRAAGKFPKRDVEEAMVARLLTDQYREVLLNVRQRIANSQFRVISASRAVRILHEQLFERVFALRQRAFTSAFKNAEIDMHLSLSTEMVPIQDFLRMVASESPQRLTVLLDRGEGV